MQKTTAIFCRWRKVPFLSLATFNFLSFVSHFHLFATNEWGEIWEGKTTWLHEHHNYVQQYACMTLGRSSWQFQAAEKNRENLHLNKEDSFGVSIVMLEFFLSKPSFSVNSVRDHISRSLFIPGQTFLPAPLFPHPHIHIIQAVRDILKLEIPVKK